MPDTFTTLTEPEFDQRIIESPAGVRVSVLANGCLQWITVGQTMVNLFVGQPLGGGPMRLLIRKHNSDTVTHVQAVGPESHAEVAVSENAFRWSGQWNELHYTVDLILHETEPAWAWGVTLDAQDSNEAAATYDAILVQDVGLADRGQIQNNEAYTSQYLDHQIFDHTTLGPVIATRQNLAQHGGQHPQLLTACPYGAAGALTDAFDFFGPAARAGQPPLHAATPTLPTQNRQYEFASHVLQARPIELTADKPSELQFVCRFQADHPDASSASDLQRIDGLLTLSNWQTNADAVDPAFGRAAGATAELLNGEPLNDDQLAECFGPANTWRQAESIQGELASFFVEQSTHVVLANKELWVDRRHAHLYTSGWSALPGGLKLSNTAYASGIFASHICLGNTSFNKLLSVSRDPLNLSRYSGLRLFVRLGGESPWRQLGAASVFAMKPTGCEWTYRLPGGRLLWVSAHEQAGDEPVLQFDVRPDRGEPIDLRLTAHVVVGDREHEQPVTVELDSEESRVTLRPMQGLLVERYPQASWTINFTTPLSALGGDELLRADGERCGWPWVVAEARQVMGLSWRVTGELGPVASGADDLKDRGLLNPDEPAATLEQTNVAGVARLNEALPWFDHNASIHLTSPHGIEQYGGAAWGVRDVCQGPVEWLLARGEGKVVARILEDVLCHQYAPRYEDIGDESLHQIGGGTWPQWYMHPPFENIQSQHSHGDVAIWPILAVVNYIRETGDFAFLNRGVGFTEPGVPFRIMKGVASVYQHIEFAIKRLVEKFIPGTSLLAYGDGDWNDSLQPARLEMRDLMVSAWTVELLYQAVRGWADIMKRFGHTNSATKHDTTANAIRDDFNLRLVLDGETIGLYLHHEDPAQAQVLLHPRDTATGVKHRLLPMIRGIISEIFTPEQARHHAELIERHLLAPDGARLMDRPPHYTGGTMTHFQRLESASFFGREIGLMYTHAHLRYAEAMAKLGDPRKLFKALLTVCPVGLEHTVPNAAPRQANFYFSSSDAAFLNRADSEARYDELMRGEVPVNGGWRVYSSGPGIFIGLVVRQWLGLRREFDRFVFDPVMTEEHDGLVAQMSLLGEACEVVYRVSGRGEGAQRVTLDGASVEAIGRDDNPYRAGGLCVDAAAFGERLKVSQKRIEVWC